MSRAEWSNKEFRKAYYRKRSGLVRKRYQSKKKEGVPVGLRLGVFAEARQAFSFRPAGYCNFEMIHAQ